MTSFYLRQLPFYAFLCAPSSLAEWTPRTEVRQRSVSLGYTLAHSNHSDHSVGNMWGVVCVVCVCGGWGAVHVCGRTACIWNVERSTYKYRKLINEMFINAHMTTEVANTDNSWSRCYDMRFQWLHGAVSQRAFYLGTRTFAEPG
jgi:hypothetical protein